MTEFAAVKALAMKERKVRPIATDLDSRLRKRGLTIDDLYSAKELEVLRDIGVIAGRKSCRDANGFTPKQHWWADVYELYHRYVIELQSDEAARSRVLKEKRLEKKWHQLDKMLRHSRDDVNTVLRHRGLIE